MLRAYGSVMRKSDGDGHGSYLFGKLKAFFIFFSNCRKIDMFSVGVTADIRSDAPIPYHELQDIIEKALYHTKLGSFVIKKDNFYELVPIRGNSAFNLFRLLV